jgi:hypothetical protein
MIPVIPARENPAKVSPIRLGSTMRMIPGLIPGASLIPALIPAQSRLAMRVLELLETLELEMGTLGKAAP